MPDNTPTSPTAPDDVAWHTLCVEDALRRVGADNARGLTSDEAAVRLDRHGPNAIPEQAGRGPWHTLLGQFTNFMTLILIAAAVVAAIVGDAVDSIAIMVIVVLNAIVGFVQEYRAERTLAALRRMAGGTAMVLRDGLQQAVPAEALVPGDIVLLEAGSAVPADLRLIEAHSLRAGEASLTGESLPVEKDTAVLSDPKLGVGDQRNMLFKGTSVLFGRTRGVVVGTGMRTRLGGIAGMLAAVPNAQTPLQLRLAVLGRHLATAALAICALVFVSGLLRGEPAMLMLLTALSLAVAAIPEALPAVVTVLLALGARHMAQAQALIRRLPAVETLGSVTFICSDKTGTLTENRMRATDLYLASGRMAIDAVDPTREPDGRMLAALALCNDVEAGPAHEPLGDPTEVALWQAARSAGADKAVLAADAPRVAEVPFDSERKRMTTIHRAPTGFIAYTKGASEAVLERCARIATTDGSADLDPDALAAMAVAMAADGLRVLAVAYRHWDSTYWDSTHWDSTRWDGPPWNGPHWDSGPAMAADEIERDLVLLGLVGMIDPPRPEARDAVATCKAAGITPVMITGDHPATARAIARQLGIAGADDRVMTGRELADLSEPDLMALVRETRVYARVDPAQKIRIVAALQAHGELVAMTGDGVNDAPALARADIGVAMGRIGTDVAREASSLVLLDDNFATIVVSVREGRRIFDNIRKFVRYAVTCNSAEIWTIFLAPFFGLPVPLLPIHILWINLVTDGLPGLALAAEPAERGVMRRKPRPPGESILAHGLGAHAVWVGLLMAGITLGTQAVAIGYDYGHWQTMVFTVLTLSQMAHVLAIRSEHDSLFRQGLLSNPPMLMAVASTFALQLAVIYVPSLNRVFHTEPLTWPELLVCIALASIILFAVEIEKLVRR